MKTITLRDVPPIIADKIEKEAERKGTSLNKTVIDLLSQAVSPTQEKRRLYHDLDYLAGSWSEDEANWVDAAIECHRTIDPELWK